MDVNERSHSGEFKAKAAREAARGVGQLLS